MYKLIDKNLNKKQISHAIDELNHDYANKAIHICQVASGFRFQAKDGLDTYISKLKDKGMNKFSKAFLETTATSVLETSTDCNLILSLPADIPA